VAIASEILEQGVSVLVEKPLSPTLADAAAMEQAVRYGEQHGAVTMMGHVMLFNNEIRRLVEEVDGRGNPVLVTSERHRPAWFSDPKRSPYANETPWYVTATASNEVYGVP
jgi:predicted dehydrogenase